MLYSSALDSLGKKKVTAVFYAIKIALSRLSRIGRKPRENQLYAKKVIYAKQSLGWRKLQKTGRQAKGSTGRW